MLSETSASGTMYRPRVGCSSGPGREAVRGTGGNPQLIQIHREENSPLLGELQLPPASSEV